MPRSLVVLVLLAVPALPAPVPKSVKAKAPELSGTWEIVELKVGEQDVTSINPKVWVIEGNRVTSYHRSGDKLTPWEPGMTITLEPTGGDPDEVDYVRVGPNDNARFMARVRLTGDEFTICYSIGGDRPAEVKAGEKVSFERYKRVKGK